jgi:hypothetical protein
MRTTAPALRSIPGGRKLGEAPALPPFSSQLQAKTDRHDVAKDAGADEAVAAWSTVRR